MLAVVKEKRGTGFVLKDVPKPEIGPRNVLIAVKSVGICGSDLPILAGTRDVPWPLIPGHEFAGDIVAAGAGVTGFRIGDRVTATLVINCGDCPYCVAGLESLCDNLLETGIHLDGAFAEYVEVPAKTVFKLRSESPYDFGASIDPVASAYRGVMQAGITPKDDVVVYGPGPIGLYAVQIVKLLGARRVISIGLAADMHRLELAKSLGADHIVVADREDAVSAVRELTDGGMVSHVIDCTGSPAILEPAVMMLKKAGTLAIIGLFHQPAEVLLGKVVRNELKIYGTICYTRNEFKACLDLVESGRIKVEPLISHHFPLREMETAWQIASQREEVKIMLHP